MLQEFKRLSNHHDTIRGKAQEIARSKVLTGWNSLNPACQLAILDYTRSVCDEFCEWNAERVGRRQKKTSADWGIYYVRHRFPLQIITLYDIDQERLTKARLTAETGRV